jgi:hypothetical protein
MILIIIPLSSSSFEPSKFVRQLPRFTYFVSFSSPYHTRRLLREHNRLIQLVHGISQYHSCSIKISDSELPRISIHEQFESITIASQIDACWFCYPSFQHLSHYELKWSEKVLHNANLYRLLAQANAIVSTYGGGYFLTRKYESAKRMARLQMQIATHLKDKCAQFCAAVHFIYIDAMECRFSTALQGCKSLQRLSDALDDMKLKRMLISAKRFIVKTRKIHDIFKR